MIQVQRTISLPKNSNPCNDRIACAAAFVSRNTTNACPLIFGVFAAFTSSTGAYAVKRK